MPNLGVRAREINCSKRQSFLTWKQTRTQNRTLIHPSTYIHLCWCNEGNRCWRASEGSKCVTTENRRRAEILVLNSHVADVLAIRILRNGEKFLFLPQKCFSYIFLLSRLVWNIWSRKYRFPESNKVVFTNFTSNFTNVYTKALSSYLSCTRKFEYVPYICFFMFHAGSFETL